MLTHIVLIKFRQDASRSEIERLLKGLRGLPGRIPEIRGYEVVEDVLHSPRSFDAGVIGRFDDVDALARYQAHREHVPLADGLRAISEQMIALDYRD